jgi:hypothetical protein
METIKIIDYVKSPEITSYGYVLPGIENSLRVYNVYHYEDLDQLKCALKCLDELQEAFEHSIKEHDLLLEYVTISYADWTEKYNAIPAWRRWIAVKAPKVEDYEPLKESERQMRILGRLLTEAHDLENLIESFEGKSGFKFEDHGRIVDQLDKFRHIGVNWLFKDI